MKTELTLPQQDIYFEQLLYPTEPIYNIGAKILIKGTLELTVFKEAFQGMIYQHDSFRTIFIREADSLRNQVLENYEPRLGFQDFSDDSNADKKAEDFMRTEFVKPFNMEGAELLYKFILIKVSPKRYYLFSVYHHIITDGWGTSLMFQRLVKNYNELCLYGQITSEYPYSYREYIEKDRTYAKSEVYLKDKTYWLEKFTPLPQSLIQPLAKRTNANKSEREVLIIQRSLYNQLNTYAKKNESSTFHLILASLFAYFGRVYQNFDFAIGLPVLNRSHGNISP